MLVILPCAGGCAMNYSKYESLLCNATVYEYPGHWTRYDEPFNENAETLVSCIASDILDIVDDEELRLFGHSMGGLIAWCVAERLIHEGVNVAQVYIAACSTPGNGNEILKENMSDKEIRSFLRVARQVPEKVLSSDFYTDNLLPAIRNDFKIVHELLHRDKKINKVLSVPITCFCGENDPIVKKRDMEYWHELTYGEFNMIMCPGDHFFINDRINVNCIVREINKTHISKTNPGLNYVFR